MKKELLESKTTYKHVLNSEVNKKCEPYELLNKPQTGPEVIIKTEPGVKRFLSSSVRFYVGLISYYHTRWRWFILICFCFTGVLWSVLKLSRIANYDKCISDEPSWDFMLFTQTYPITSCVWWQVTKGEQQCNFAHDKRAWTVHGIWPTKKDTEGPLYCHYVPFNETALESIKSELQEHWLSIGYESNTNNDAGDVSFWRHEWRKHGTCAIDDKIVFDSELTYFKLGLEWNRRFNLTHILTAVGIIPNNTEPYTKQEFYDAVRNAVGKSPFLDCFHHKELDRYLLQEIRLCMSKDLHLLDCDEVLGLKNNSCDVDEIFYPEDLPVSPT